jgi:hypothetical protein
MSDNPYSDIIETETDSTEEHELQTEAPDDVYRRAEAMAETPDTDQGSYVTSDTDNSEEPPSLLGDIARRVIRVLR